MTAVTSNMIINSEITAIMPNVCSMISRTTTGMTANIYEIIIMLL